MAKEINTQTKAHKEMLIAPAASGNKRQQAATTLLKTTTTLLSLRCFMCGNSQLKAAARGGQKQMHKLPNSVWSANACDFVH